MKKQTLEAMIEVVDPVALAVSRLQQLSSECWQIKAAVPLNNSEGKTFAIVLFLQRPKA